MNFQSFQVFSPITTALAIAVFFFSYFPPAYSQDVQTLFGNDVRHGGFGGPVVKIGQIDGSGAVWVGGRGGWILNIHDHHSISVGGGGYGLATEHRMPHQTDGFNNDLAAIGYGGFEIEYTNRSYRLLHLTATSLIGAGGLTIRDDMHNVPYDDHNAFFVWEPGLHAELNVTTFFRIATGLSYRLTSGIDMGGFGDGDFSGWNSVLTLKFGSF